MRLTAILLIAGMIQVHAKGFSQTVTLSERDASLQTIFQQIKKQTGFTFFYNEELLEQAGKVSIQVKNAPLTTALDLCFRNQPLMYSIIGNTVVIKNRSADKKPEETMTIPLPSITIKGRLTNMKGEPLANATITIKKSKRSIITDVNGGFFLENVNNGDILVISFIGYKTEQITITPQTEPNIMVMMQVADSKLDEVIIQGYGTTSRRSITGNIVKVSSEEIEKQPVMNPLLALAGRVPGLVVTPTSGYASGPVKIEIRGRKMISNAYVSDPLFIVDGVPLTTVDAGGSSNYTMGSSGLIQNGMTGPAQGQSPLFSLNPADIESIEVLKDADATAIYGSRGANGVILITTKKATPGASRFNFAANQGISTVTKHWDMLNTSQYLQMRREAFMNDGIIPTPANAPDLLVWDTTRYTDWQKELWGNQGKVTNITAGLSGGDARTQFRLSSNYSRQTEILTNSGANQRASLSFNLSHASMNRKFRMDFTTNYSYTVIDAVTVPAVTTLPPNAPPIYNSKGEMNFDEWNKAGLSFSYPFASLGTPYSSTTNFLTTNMMLRYEIVKGLELTGSFGYNNSQNNNRSRTPIAVQNPVLNPTGQSAAGATNNNNWIIEPQLNYKTIIGRGKLSILLGGTAQTNKTRGTATNGTGYTNDNLLGSVALAPVKNYVDNYGEYKYAAMFGRINFDWAGKYILNLNGRRDGSSRFGPGKQFGNFGSAGAAWIISEENWVKDFLPSFISFAKLRGNYGITGSDAIGEYKYLSQWSSTATMNFANYQPYGGITPLVSQLAVNSDYHWQVNKKLEAALSLGFLKDRINLEVAYYRDRCDNQLTQYPTPVYTGFPNVTANWPATVQNSGWEFMMNAKLVENKNVSWSVNFNGAFNDNKLLEYPNIERSPYATYYKVGQSLNTLYLLHSTGINPLTGSYSFADYNHDGQIIPYSNLIPGVGINDRYATRNLSPKFTGGFGSDVRYKNFRVGCFFSFKKQDAQNAWYSINTPGMMSNIPVAILKDHWQKPGDISRFPGFSTVQTFNYLSSSDGAYTDASFVRLSNLSFSYSLPQQIVKKAGLQQCNLFMYAQNVFVITNYDGIDPEATSFGTLPPAKIFTAGISFNF